MLNLVISGGNSGSDLAGLVAAERCGIPTGGTAPKNYKTEAGFQPILRDRFNLVECGLYSYPARTAININNSDVTVILSTNMNSPGTKLTIRLCIDSGRKYFTANPFTDNPDQLKDFLMYHRPKTVNIAGNRESVSPGITRSAANYLTRCFNNINSNKIKRSA